MQDKFGTFGVGETALVIGLGKSGLASIAVLRERGAAVFVTDEKPPEHLRDAIAVVESQGASFLIPGALDRVLPEISFAVLSPGIAPASPLVRRIAEARISVVGEVELAYRLCAAPMIAVTGTKGKSTTTALIGHLLRACGRDVRVGGNIGNPLISAVAGAGPQSWVVAEVSSFQLETIATFNPRISVLLNVAPDHLDRYACVDEYAEAKFRIFANQGEGDTIVLDLDDPRLAALEARLESSGCKARRLWYALHEDRRARAAMYLRDAQIVYAPRTGDSQPVAVADRRSVPFAGEHNVRNAMAALLAVLAAGCGVEPLREAVRTFRGLPHRLQRVGEIDGVVYVDDSKATNPSATIAALRTYDRPIVLIAGGRPKRTEFGELGMEIRERVKTLIAIGEAADALAQEAGNTPCEVASSMEDAVFRARRSATSGDVVLLSPACASFDMFASAEERGERFIRAVDALREPAAHA